MSDVKITGFKIISLNELLAQLGEERTREILSSFSCPINKDVEDFLKHKAIIFDNQSISRTKLVFTSYKQKIVLVGYFTLAYKDFMIPDKALSSNLKRRLNKFGSYDKEMKIHRISAPLIAQLGKNFDNEYNKLITGDELLQIACDCVKEVQMNIGGKIVYVECEDKVRLIEFYERNGFAVFSQRQLDKNDKQIMQGNYLLQLLRYL